MVPNSLIMEPEREGAEEQVPLKTREEQEEEEEDEQEEEEEEEQEGEDDEEEEEEEDEEEDAKIFNAWMQQYRGGDRQRRPGGEGEEQEEEQEEGGGAGGRPGSRTSIEHPVRTRTDRRASLPCPATLSAMQLSRLHSSTGAAVTARVLLHRTSSRRLLLSPQEALSPSPATPVPKPALERRPSLIPTVPTIPEVAPPERRSQFRRRNVMSLSDAYSVCLICHNDLNQGSGTRELQCTHTFHKECIEEWLWRKQSCPTCRVQVSLQQPVYDYVKVP